MNIVNKVRMLTKFFRNEKTKLHYQKSYQALNVVYKENVVHKENLMSYS